MSDNKARRVLAWVYPGAVNGEWQDDPNGTHMLVPVEVWERAVREIDRIAKPRYGDVPEDAERLARRALAEIGGEDGG